MTNWSKGCLRYRHALFISLISHQPSILFSHTKSASATNFQQVFSLKQISTNNQPKQTEISGSKAYSNPLRAVYLAMVDMASATTSSFSARSGRAIGDGLYYRIRIRTPLSLVSVVANPSMTATTTTTTTPFLHGERPHPPASCC